MSFATLHDRSSAAPAVGPVRLGDAIAGRYVLEKPIGGGMSQVFRAWDLVAERLVALKLLDHLHGDDVARFERETALLSNIRDTRVVSYLGHGVSNGMHYLVTEWLEGETLTQRLHHRGLSLREATEVIRLLCHALRPLHERGIVHRDIKPDNIVLEGGRVDGLKLIDLGLARIVAASTTRVTASGIMVGTPGYTSPEQARGERALDGRADIFALGCVLYDCLTGYPAFAGSNYLAVQSKILLVDPPAIEQFNPDVPPALSALAMRMLAKTRDERPAGIDDILVALDRLPHLPDAPRRRSAHDQPDTRNLRAASAERMRGLVVARRRSALPDLTRTMTALERSEYDTSLCQAIKSQGGNVHVLDDDSLVATFELEPIAERSARAALALKPLLADATIAIVTGGVSLDELVDRAAHQLDAAARIAAFDDTAGIAVDAETARVLGPRFEVRNSDGRWRLAAERAA